MRSMLVLSFLAVVALGCPGTPPRNPGQVVSDGGSAIPNGQGGHAAGQGGGSSAGTGTPATRDAGAVHPAADGGGVLTPDAAEPARDAATAPAAPSCDSSSCEVYQHCELQQVTCIRAPCPPEPHCIDNPTCGGFAGRPCAGMASCIDDPRDSCDPKHGGADCGGLCVCDPKLVVCDPGKKLDTTGCQCVNDLCAAVRCKAGTHCVSDGKTATCPPL